MAVTNLLYRYAELVDLGDFAGVGQLLAHAEISVEGIDYVQRGPEVITGTLESWTRRYEDDGTPHTRHVITNPIVEVDAEAGTATIRSSFTVLQQLGPGVVQPIIIGRYHDRFERVDGQWRFTARHLFNDLTGDLSQHLLNPLP